MKNNITIFEFLTMISSMDGGDAIDLISRFQSGGLKVSGISVDDCIEEKDDLDIIAEWRKEFERDFANQGTGHGFNTTSFGGYESPLVRYMWQGYCMGRKIVRKLN